jgi:hypothetical protein
VNTVAPELVLCCAKSGKPLCGPGADLAPSEPVEPTFMPDASLPADARAKQVLLHVLDGGVVAPATAVQAAAKRYGIPRRALARAQTVLGIRPRKTPIGWTWELPKGETA